MMEYATHEAFDAGSYSQNPESEGGVSVTEDKRPIMTSKAYLSQYRLLDLEIDRLLEEKALWAALATKATPSFSQGGRGQGGDRIQLAVEKIAEWEEKIDGRVNVLVELRQEIEGKLAALPDPRFRELLHRRYILGQKWEAIGEEMNYSVMQIHRLHSRALQMLKM